MKKLNVVDTKITHQQTVVILNAVSEGNFFTELGIALNDLSGVHPGLLAMAVTKVNTLNINCTKLTKQ